LAGPDHLGPYPLPEYHKAVDFFSLGSKISVNFGPPLVFLHMVGQEEQKIRTNPVAQTTDLLKKVFGK
jgi:hypothetical protein